MQAELFLLLPIFFVIALIYSSAGFGGGSSYLAVLALFPVEIGSIRMLALVCNIVVVSSSVYLFYRSALIDLKKILPLVGISMPLAYVGGRYRLSEDTFFIILGLTLFVAAVLMLVNSPRKKGGLESQARYTGVANSVTNSVANSVANSVTNSVANSVMGGGIGLVSGMVGIGGGIFLSPVLHLSSWDIPKKIAATTAVFILVNSVAGLLGQWPVPLIARNYELLIALGLSVLLGGQIGSRLTISIFHPQTVKRITGLLILLVAIRILYTSM